MPVDGTPSEVAPGVWCIALATPWLVGPVNLYLIADDPLTLIDAGQRSPESLAELEAALGLLGLGVRDLGRVVITHQHPDHSGMAQDLVDRSGAELCALEPLATWMEAYPGSIEADRAFADEVLRRHGRADAVEESRTYRGGNQYGAAAVATRPLRDGDTLDFAGRRLQVLHRPGHSPYDTVFHDEQSEMLFGGDHLLDRRSTPLLEPSAELAVYNGRPQPFVTYLESLRATEAMELDLVLPGHGEPVRGHREIIAERLERYAHDTQRVDTAVTSEPRTAAEIATDIRGPIRASAAFYALCDVLGHLDLLAGEGTVVESVDGDGLHRFARA